MLQLKVNWLDYILDDEWEIFPAGGATGDAYFAQLNDKRLFLKRNSSPFLAVLSAEGIVPKLMWTKRLENGDVITAQHWINGRGLKPKDMNGSDVAHLLRKIHHSNELLDMLKRLQKKPLQPEEILSDIKELLGKEPELSKLSIVLEGLQFLEMELPNIHYEQKVVCHCDVNHNNWLETAENQLYLIDWDGAMIADPAIDIGLLLHWYIDEEEWDSWLDLYGLELTENLHLRMKWYVVSQTILSIIWYKSKDLQKETNHWLHYLQSLFA